MAPQAAEPLLFFLQSLFSLFCSDWIVEMFLCLLFLSSVILILLSPFNEFLNNSDCIFQFLSFSLLKVSTCLLISRAFLSMLENFYNRHSKIYQIVPISASPWHDYLLSFVMSWGFHASLYSKYFWIESWIL